MFGRRPRQIWVVNFRLSRARFKATVDKSDVSRKALFDLEIVEIDWRRGREEVRPENEVADKKLLEPEKYYGYADPSMFGLWTTGPGAMAGSTGRAPRG